MKPLFDAEPKAAPVADPLVGFQQILTPQVSQPIVVATPATATPGRIVTDADIDKLGEANASRIAQTTSKILANVKASDTDTMGKKLNELISEAKKLDPAKLGKPGFFGKLLGVGKNVKEQLMANYASVETQMTRLTKELDDMAALMKKRAEDCETLFEDNFQTYQSLQGDIKTGQAMIADIEAQIAALGTPSDAFGAQTIADLQARAERLRKRCDDFDRGCQLAILAAPEIRMQQGHCRSLASTVRDIKVTTLPAWQGVFSRYVLALESRKGAKIVNTVYDATDAAFRMQADQLRENTQQIARAQQRSVVTIETLEHMQTQLLGAVDDALKIANEGRKAREAAQPKLRQLEQGLISRFSPQNLIASY